jgi:hypothetical protein
VTVLEDHIAILDGPSTSV